MYTNTVQRSTQRTYGTAERRWLRIALQIGTDPCMRMIPAEWYNRQDKFRQTTLTWPEACVVTLLASFVEDGHAVSPRTAGVYLSGVRKYWQNNGVDTRFMDNSQYIQNTKAGLAQLYRVQQNRTAADSERLPITIDMIQGYHKSTGGDTPTLPQQAVYTAAMLGFTIVARVSEYLQTDGAEHWLRTEDVTFELNAGPSTPAHQAYRHMHNHTPMRVSILIRSKKNDKRGRGFKYHFQVAHHAATYCIVNMLWNYAINAKPTKGNSLFHIPELSWTLKPPYFAARLKELAEYYDIDPSRISSHSIRIGGATTLAAAGLTDCDIRSMGDWKSNSFMQYIRKNVELFDRVRQALSNPEAMTVREVKRAYDTESRMSQNPQRVVVQSRRAQKN